VTEQPADGCISAGFAFMAVSLLESVLPQQVMKRKAIIWVPKNEVRLDEFR
jgi:hypothetical protein